ncbi:MAG: hypothetical protein CMK30_05785 [Porticoccaceae bacterium]|nr:hypothetical protein [Porticoccaceae bacterium]
MNNKIFFRTQFSLKKLSVFLLSYWISACSYNLVDGDLETDKVSTTREAVINITNEVADWQLSHLSDFKGHIKTFVERSRDPREWHQGTFFKGLADWAIESGDEKKLLFLRDIGSSQEFKLGDRIYHADDHVVGQYYLVLYDFFLEPVMFEHTQRQFDLILSAPSEEPLNFDSPGIEAGYYKRCLKRWCWSDALFMSPPVWTRLTKITGNSDYVDFSNAEYWRTVEYLFDKDSSLFFRDSRFFSERESNGEKIFWSRGNGWVFSGLTDIIDNLPDDHPDLDRYIKLYLSMAAALLPLQGDAGYWPVSLRAGDLYPAPETSGTAFFVAGLAWGVSNGLLDKDTYLSSVLMGWSALVSSVAPSGMIGWVQQVGEAPSQVFENETQLYGAGAFLLAGSAVLRLHTAGILPL